MRTIKIPIQAIPVIFTLFMFIMVFAVGLYVLDKVELESLICQSINASVDITSDTCGIGYTCPPRRCIFENGTVVDMPEMHAI